MGYSVSGHGLDGLKKYIYKRTIGIEQVRLFQAQMKEKALQVNLEDIAIPSIGNIEHTDEEHTETTGEILPPSVSPTEVEKPAPEEVIETPDIPDIPQKKEKRKELPRVRFVGLVTGIRKMQTKTGKLMMLAKCESVDFRFTITVFPKEYDKYATLIEEDKIVLVEGGFQGNEQMEEMSVIPQSIKSTTITFVRTQAQELGLFDANDIINYYPIEEESHELPKATQKIIKKEEVKTPQKPSKNEYIIQIPPKKNREDLLVLKDFLLTQKEGNIQVYIFVNGQKIDTKIRVDEVGAIKRWIKKHF
jgi:DNA polymerase III alpha subunit